MLPLKGRGLAFCGPPPPPGTALVQLYDDPNGKTLGIVKTIYDELFSLFPDKVFDIGAVSWNVNPTGFFRELSDVVDCDRMRRT